LAALSVFDELALELELPESELFDDELEPESDVDFESFEAPSDEVDEPLPERRLSLR
jgi:hypothetical protein